MIDAKVRYGAAVMALGLIGAGVFFAVGGQGVTPGMSLPFGCSNGQSPQWDGTQWQCRVVGDYASTHYDFTDEWMTVSSNNWQTATTGTGAQLASVGAATNRPGLVGLQTGTTTTGMTRLGGVAQSVFTSSNATVTVEGVVGVTAVSSGTDEYTVVFGLAGGLASADPTNGCYFEYDRGNVSAGNTNPSNTHALECVSANSSTRTKYLINGSGNSDESFPLGTVTVGAVTWSSSTNVLHLKVTMTGGTRCEFYSCAGASCTKVCDINTNIPSSFFGQAIEILKSAGTNSRELDIDWTRVAFDQSQRTP